MRLYEYEVDENAYGDNLYQKKMGYQQNEENTFRFNEQEEISQRQRIDKKEDILNGRSLLLKKRQSFRSQIRKQYLKSYFQKRRIQLFGQKCDGFDKNTYTIEVRQFQCFNQKNQFKGQIDQNIGDVQENLPIYNNDYFDGVILLERLIDFDDDQCEKYHPYNNNQNLKYNNVPTSKDSPIKTKFRYQSFYSFLMATIQDNLNYSYFQTLNQNRINHQSQLFKQHFNALKNTLYRKLAKQMEDFLFSVQQFNLEKCKKDSWAYRNILLQTYIKLVTQITNFIKSENLQYGNNLNEKNESSWPIILIEEQLTILINMLISMTYYDGVEKQGQQIDVFQGEHNENEDDAKFNIKMTRMMIEDTQLLDTLKFMIVFGTFSESQSQNQQSNDLVRKERRRKQRIILIIVQLLRNISINLGSDVLLQSGLIGQLKCILKQPYFNIEIRKSNKLKNDKNNMRKNNDFLEKPLFHYKIEQFIVEQFQMIRHQQSVQYLSQIQSFQFAFDTLAHIYDIKKHSKQRNCQNLISPNQYLQVGGQIILYECPKRDHLDNNHTDQFIQSDQDSCDFTNDIDEILRKKKSQTLTKLAQQCIQCINFHFYLGQVKLTQQHLNTNSFSTPINQTLKFSSRNRFVVKFHYMPEAEQVLGYFQQGKSLLQKIPSF